MALFTVLTSRDARDVACCFGLGAVTRWEGIAHGTINSNYRMEANGVFFVRINEGKAEVEVAYEAELVASLSSRGVPTPCPRAAADGRPYALLACGLVTVFPWVEGVHRLAGDALAADLEAVGGALARIHLAGADFPLRQESRYSTQRIGERLSRLARSAAPELAPLVAELNAELCWLAGVEGRAELPRGVIHGDLFPDNVLFGAADLPTLIDFEQASDGAFAYDLAVCLCAWCFDDDFVAERVGALLGGYQAVRRLVGDERELLWVEARAAALRFTVTRMTDVHLNPAASEVLRRTKDYRRFHARLVALRALGAERFGAWMES